jgi:hypothetical protein
MKVTAEQIKAMRHLLSGDVEGYEQLQAGLDPNTSPSNGALISATFFTAAERRFTESSTRTDVVEFVGNLRARSDRLAADLDPRVAERLLLATFTDEEIDDIGPEVRGQHCFLLLGGLAADADYSESELDDLLATSLSLANEWLTEAR